MKSIIFNLSGVFDEEEFRQGEVIDLRKIEGTNCYCCRESADILRNVAAGCDIGAIHWIDTGDYHYLSLFFAERIDRDFELLLFDNHPDNQPLAFETDGTLSCGSWVKTAQETLPHLKNVSAKGVGGYAPERKELPVYLSIDLDVLGADEFKTDWDQGTLSLDSLISAVRETASEREIIGIDICGGITRSKKAADKDLRLNKSVRERLMLELAGTV